MSLDAETFALGWDMTMPMTEVDLAGRTLSELRVINETLARRAAEVLQARARPLRASRRRTEQPRPLES